MNILDMLKGKPKEVISQRVVVNVDGLYIDLGEEPFVGVGIGDEPVIRSQGNNGEETGIFLQRTGNKWYLYGPFTEGAIVRDRNSLDKLKDIVKRLD